MSFCLLFFLLYLKNILNQIRKKKQIFLLSPHPESLRERFVRERALASGDIVL